MLARKGGDDRLNRPSSSYIVICIRYHEKQTFIHFSCVFNGMETLREGEVPRERYNWAGKNKEGGGGWREGIVKRPTIGGEKERQEVGRKRRLLYARYGNGNCD